MQIVRSAVAMQRLALRWRRDGARVAFVPTMGCLHDGHISLARRARKLAGPRGRVVVSIYVNPTQFGPKEDFKRYPRDLKGDARLCRAAGVDVIFAPANLYAAASSTWIVEESLTRPMEGASRPGHFRGVTTVVAKLFHLVLPDVAVFGAKDWQQAAVVRRMVRDLDFPVKLVVAPTRRERDGLAMSSRNRYLEGDLRRQARVLWRAICLARETVRRSSRPVSSSTLRARLRRLIESEPAARVDYVEFFDPDTLEPARRTGRGTHLAMAVFVGKTRLIDNARL
ncbi:MAG: pantoate--beta-alanine ligase [Verrucomicrobiota bacterium]